MYQQITYFLGLFSIVVACVTTGVAQQGNPDSGIEQSLKIETTLVSVPVIVSDREGRYIAGLKQTDFALYEDRIKQQIAFFADNEEPINVALLIDTSRSTLQVLSDIKRAAYSFINHLRAKDRAMIVSFDFRVRTLCDLTSDHRLLERAIDQASIGERFGTRLREAINDVIVQQFRAVKGRKAIILLTDGKDYGSDISEQALIEAISEADAPIYSVFYTTGPIVTGGRRDDIWGNERLRRRGAIQRRVDERNENAIGFLQTLSDNSAGRYYRSEMTDLVRTFEQIVEELRHQYRLGFYPPTDHPAGSVHQLKVEVTRAGVVVRARRNYRVSGSSGEDGHKATTRP